MQKMVLKLGLQGDKEKKKALKIVSKFEGVDLIEINMKDQKLTVSGAMDPVEVVAKLRKAFNTEIISVGPAKADQKKDENKKDDQDKKKNDDKSGKDSKADPGKVYPLMLPYHYYPHHPPPLYYYGRNMSVVEEDPNGCLIC